MRRAGRAGAATRSARAFSISARLPAAGRSAAARAGVIDRINAATGETIHLAILQGFSVMKVVKRDARHAIRVDSDPSASPMRPHATATGRRSSPGFRTTSLAACSPPTE